MSLFLTADELHELTGYKLAKYQLRWLRENGYVVDVDRFQRPKLLRQALLARQGVKMADPDTTEPNFEAMDGQAA